MTREGAHPQGQLQVPGPVAPRHATNFSQELGSLVALHVKPCMPCAADASSLAMCTPAACATCSMHWCCPSSAMVTRCGSGTMASSMVTKVLEGVHLQILHGLLGVKRTTHHLVALAEV